MSSDSIKKDKLLIKKIINSNDQKAYAELLNKYNKSLLFMVLKLVNNRDDADDIVMQTFTKAFKSLDTYNDQYAFTTWLYRIGTNTCIDFLRKKRIKTTSLDRKMDEHSESSSSFSQNILDTELDPEEKFVQKQRSHLMQEVVQSMDEKYRILIELRFFKELKYSEIAEKLEIPIGTVKVRISRAKALLTEILENHKDKF